MLSDCFVFNLEELFSANIDFIETHQQHTFLLDQLRKTCRNTITKVEETLWSIKFTCKLVPDKLRGAKERILRNFSPVKCERERDSPPSHTSIFAVWTIHLK